MPNFLRKRTGWQHPEPPDFSKVIGKPKLKSISEPVKKPRVMRRIFSAPPPDELHFRDLAVGTFFWVPGGTIRLQKVSIFNCKADDWGGNGVPMSGDKIVVLKKP